jgi:hypothetical protein
MKKTISSVRDIEAYYNKDHDFMPLYPISPGYYSIIPGKNHDESNINCTNQGICPVNIEYDTISNNYPKQVSILGPSSLKHIYTGIPNFYPPMTKAIPYNTMYGPDLSSYGPFGKRNTYGFQAFPFHSQSNREIREYTTGREWEKIPGIIPVLDLMKETRNPISYDGAWNR